MAVHIDYNDPGCAQAATEILRRHDNGEPEANITSAVRDFLVATGLASGEDMVEENPPAQGSRRAVDLAALDTFIEFKRRIGSAGGFNPNAEYVHQLDDYLAQSERQGRMRMGILTDGRRWLLRWPNAGPVKMAPPYAFTLEDADRWFTLFEWLRDHALSAEEDKEPSRSAIVQHFGPLAPSYERDIAALKTLYSQYADASTIRVKRHLWENLLTAALGEIARTPSQLDDLFCPPHLPERRHRLGGPGILRRGHPAVSLRQTRRNLLFGRDFRSKTGLQGVVESDFFAWPTEVGGAAAAEEHGPSHRTFRLAESSQRRGRHPLRDRDTGPTSGASWGSITRRTGWPGPS